MDQGTASLVGRLSRDPQLFGEGDKQRALFTVAYNRGVGDNRKSNFVDCIAWGKRADIMRDFTKGMGIFVTGDIEQDSYTDKDGVKKNRIQVKVYSITATTSTRRNDTPERTGEEVSITGDKSSASSEGIPF